MAIVVVKHLPGQHDQMTHGNRKVRVASSGMFPGRPEHKLVDTYDEIKDGPFGKGYFILPDGKLADVTDDFVGSMDESHVGWLIASDNYKLFGLDKKDADFLRNTFVGPPTASGRQWEIYDAVWKKIFDSGIVRVREWHNEISIEIGKIDNRGLRKIQSLVDSDKIGLSIGKEIIISGYAAYDNNVYTNYEELMSAKYVVGEELKQSKKRKIVITKGGPGSGHWGHAGRPGKIGGSLPMGGPGKDVFRPSTGARESSYADAPPLYPGEHDPINKFLNQGLKQDQPYVYGSIKHAAWAVAMYDDRGDMKAEIVSELSNRTGVDEDVVNEIIGQWASTSNDEDLRSLSLQKAASEEFGVDMSEWQLEKYNEFDLDAIESERKELEDDMFNQLMERRGKTQAQGYDNPMTRSSVKDVRDLAKIYAKSAIKSKYHEHSLPITSRNDECLVLRAMYDYTQQEFMKAGFSRDDTILIWRGIGGVDIGIQNKLADYHGNAIESWSASYKVAQDFRSIGGDVVGAYVPIRNILGTCKSGFGCWTEGEIVTFGTIPDMQVRVVDPGELFRMSKLPQEEYEDVYGKQHKQDYSDKVMIALPVTDPTVMELWKKFGSSDEVLPLHITLLYLGEAEGLDKDAIVNILREFSQQQAPIEGKYNGAAIFTDNGDGYPHVLLYDSPQLPFCHATLSNLLLSHRPELTHGFTAHTTLAYRESPDKFITDVDIPYTFNAIMLQWGDEERIFPLFGDVIHKGGKGSGHHGHSGRPGKIGGSLPADSLPYVSSNKKDKGLSKELAEECGAQSKECYKNSVMAMVRVEDSKYVEGYFVIDFGDFQFPVEHGWLEKPDGTIVDITLPDDEGTYIPANSWTFKEAMTKVSRSDETLPFSNYSDDNWRKAAVQAWDMLGVTVEKGGPGSGHFGHSGRPGKIGGSMPKGSGKGARAAGHTNIDEGGDGNLSVDAMLTMNLESSRFINATDDERSLVKKVNVAELSRRTGIPESEINDILKDWAVSSNDNNYSMLLLQEAAAETIGVELGDWQKAKLEEIREFEGKEGEWFRDRERNALMDIQEIEHEWNKKIKAARERGEFEEFAGTHRQEYSIRHAEALKVLTKYEKEQNLFHAGLYDPGPLTKNQRKLFIQEMYIWTQSDLQSLAYLHENEEVTLFRGINRDYLDYKKNDVVSYKGNAIESWSLSDRSAADFAFNIQSGTGIVMAMTVPRRAIISTAVTGLGCLSEGEVIISGTVPGHMVSIYDIIQFDEAYND